MDHRGVLGLREAGGGVRERHEGLLQETDTAAQHAHSLSAGQPHQGHSCLGKSINLSIYLSILLSVYQSIFLSFYLSINLSFYPSICLSIYPSICLSIYTSICQLIYPYIYLSTFPSLFICQSVHCPLD